jgi:exonuclease SbcC
MLLAQGGFAAFLAAAPDDRSPILEQITGTAVYSDISKLVHLRKTDEHKKLDLLMAETAGIVLLTDEEEALTLEDLEKKKETEADSRRKSDEARTAILWLTGMDTLKSELCAIRSEAETLSLDVKVFEPDRKRLQEAVKAAELDSPHATLQSLRDQQKTDLEALLKTERLIPERQKALEIRQDILDKAEANLILAREEQKKELLLIKAVRALDLQIFEKKAFLETLSKEWKKIETEVAGKKEEQKKAVQDLALAEKNLSEVNHYLLSHAADADLVTRLAGIEEQVRGLKAGGEKQAALKKEVFGFQKSLEAARMQCRQQASIRQGLEEKHGACLKAVGDTKKELEVLLGGRLLREYRAEHESLLREMAYVRKIQSLEQERENLLDNSPCPLCGSLQHPFALGNIPRADQTEEKINLLSSLIKKAEGLEKRLKDGEDLEKSSGFALAEAEKKEVLVRHQEEEVQTAFLRSEKEFQMISEELARQNEALAFSLKPFGIEKMPEKGPDTLMENLKTRQKNFQDHQDQKIHIEKLQTALAARISGADMIIKTFEDRMNEIKAKGIDQKKEVEQLSSDRSQSYGHKIPDMEESRLEKKAETAEALVKAERKNRDDIKEALREGMTRILALKETTEKRRSGLSVLQASFLSACRAAGFENEEAFLFVRLSPDERKNLSERARKLDESVMEIAARKNDREQRLLIETQKKLTDQGLDDLRKEEAALKESLKQLGEEIGAIKQKLSGNQLLKEKLSRKKQLIDLQKIECARWDNLHGLIGSADGKKYRNFAQGLTFEIMVAHANRQLEKMSDRYLLIRDEVEPLELNIVDNYQAGEIRSTKNLSGGESFIVSLSLALGLSHMSGRKVRVDSLFLDEGFGTLDEDALEIALEALAGLHRQGKLIGIISHVPALKERIGTRISITPVSGGKSILTGPGCKAL